MWTLPTACPGKSLTVICAAVSTLKQGVTGVAGHGVTMMSVVSTRTSVALVNAVPVRITVLPPATGPAVGAMLLIVGTAAYVYWSAFDVALVPPGVVTVISTVPAEAAGTSTVIDVALFTVKQGALPQLVVTCWAPTETWVVENPLPMKPLPVTVTAVPPLSGPLVGATLLTAGHGGVAVRLGSGRGSGSARRRHRDVDAADRMSGEVLDRDLRRGVDVEARGEGGYGAGRGRDVSGVAHKIGG